MNWANFRELMNIAAAEVPGEPSRDLVEQEIIHRDLLRIPLPARFIATERIKILNGMYPQHALVAQVALGNMDAELRLMELLDGLENPNARDQNGDTLLHLAAANFTGACARVVLKLLAMDADTNIANNNGIRRCTWRPGTGANTSCR